jgi:Colicin V production protein
MIVNILLLLVFVAVVIVLTREGLWSGLVMLLNIVAAATVSTAWYERVATLIDERMPSYTYLIDFLALWGLFAAVLLVMRLVTDRVSRTKVKFLRQVEMAGSPLVAAVAGWIMVCFAAASLHTAPVPRSVIQAEPDSRGMFFGLAPDRKWLAWVRFATKDGPFAFAPGSAVVFDNEADFILRYGDRRLKLEQADGLRVQ